MALVQLDNVKRFYTLGEETIHAVNGVSLTINDGEFVSIVGPSGAGKSTLLNLIGCIDTPTDGSVKIHGKCTNSLSDNQLSEMRGSNIGFIFQSFNLINVFNVLENVDYPLIINKNRSAESRERVHHIIEKVGLSSYMKHVPNQLSGGQRQRVAIARALIHNPKIVLADEPTANLDSKTSGEIIDLMHEMREVFRTTFIFSTHDPDVVKHAEKIYEIKDGRLINDK